MPSQTTGFGSVSTTRTTWTIRTVRNQTPSPSPSVATARTAVTDIAKSVKGNVVTGMMKALNLGPREEAPITNRDVSTFQNDVDWLRLPFWTVFNAPQLPRGAVYPSWFDEEVLNAARDFVPTSEDSARYQADLTVFPELALKGEDLEIQSIAEREEAPGTLKQIGTKIKKKNSIFVRYAQKSSQRCKSFSLPVHYDSDSVCDFFVSFDRLSFDRLFFDRFR
jgi:hypothetical protein